jgi:hypothetical protein
LFNSSPLAVPMRCRDVNDVANTHFPSVAWSRKRTERVLRDAFQRNDRQVLVVRAVFEHELRYGTGSSSHERVPRIARRPSRPIGSRPCASCNRARRNVPERGTFVDILRLRWPVALRKLASPGVSDRKSSSFRNP